MPPREATPGPRPRQAPRAGPTILRRLGLGTAAGAEIARAARARSEPDCGMRTAGARHAHRAHRRAGAREPGQRPALPCAWPAECCRAESDRYGRNQSDPSHIHSQGPHRQPAEAPTARVRVRSLAPRTQACRSPQPGSGRPGDADGVATGGAAPSDRLGPLNQWVTGTGDSDGAFRMTWHVIDSDLYLPLRAAPSRDPAELRCPLSCSDPRLAMPGAFAVKFPS